MERHIASLRSINEAISRDELARLLRYKRAWHFWFGGRMAEEYTPKKESTDV